MGLIITRFVVKQEVIRGTHTTDGFVAIGSTTRAKIIKGAYVDGLSITLGNPCKYMWTYAVGFHDEHASQGNCPCTSSPGTSAFTFINNDYYCESESSGTGQPSNAYLTSDSLWDAYGSGCTVTYDDCCTNVNIPWIFRQFHNSQQDDIEVRICANQDFEDEAVALDQLQLFVQ